MDKDKIIELVKNKAELISLKKASIKFVKDGISCTLPKSNSTYKSIEKADTEDSISRTIIGNTYNWLDSHGDVHAKSVFKKSITERQKSIFHLHDHRFEIVAKVGEPEKIYEQSISWKDLGVAKSGDTEALFMDSNILKSYNERIFKDYESGTIQQHSVGMHYTKIDLAVSDDEFEEEHKVWKENIDKLGNREDAEEQGFFWYVREAKLVEISAVLLGSNSLTPTMNIKSEPSLLEMIGKMDTHKNKADENHFDIMDAISKQKF